MVPFAKQRHHLITQINESRISSQSPRRPSTGGERHKAEEENQTQQGHGVDDRTGREWEAIFGFAATSLMTVMLECPCHSPETSILCVAKNFVHHRRIHCVL